MSTSKAMSKIVRLEALIAALQALFCLGSDTVQPEKYVPTFLGTIITYTTLFASQDRRKTLVKFLSLYTGLSLCLCAK